MHLTHSNISVGQRVVIASQHLGFFSPVQHHNGRCSGVVLSVGRKYAHVESNGAPWKVLITEGASASAWRAYDMGTARRLYEQSLQHLNESERARAIASL